MTFTLCPAHSATRIEGVPRAHKWRPRKIAGMPALCGWMLILPAIMLIVLRVQQAGCSAYVSISPRAVHHALLAKMSVSSTVFVELRAPEGQVRPTCFV